MRRFQRALTREMAAMASTAFAALSAIFIVVLLVRTLGRAAVGDLAVGAVLPMLAFSYARFMPPLLSLALFVGVFMSLSRLWRDSEAVIWMGGGVGPLYWIRPVLRFVLPVLVLIGLLSLEGLPWAARMQAEFEQQQEARSQVSALAPGVFTEDRQGRRVFFVEGLSGNGRHVENVFIQSRERGRMGVTVARRGDVQETENGETFLVLQQGKRFEGLPGDPEFVMVDFESQSVRIPAHAVEHRASRPRALTSAQLLEDPSPHNMAEWVQRLGHPLIALMLCLLAVPMSYVNPRAGRSLNVVFAILIYAAYNNVAGLSEGWVERSALRAWQSMLAVHGSMLLILVAFFWQRFRGPWAK